MFLVWAVRWMVELFRGKEESQRDSVDGREVLRTAGVVYIVELEVSDGFSGAVPSGQLDVRDRPSRGLGWSDRLRNPRHG